MLSGKVDVGEVGIRVIGLLWLLVALTFFATGALLIGRHHHLWQPITLGTTLISLLLCLLGLPESRFGIPVNIVLLVFVLVAGAFGWGSFLGV